MHNILSYFLRMLSCEQCLDGIRATQDFVVKEETIYGIVGWLSYGDEENGEEGLCPDLLVDLDECRELIKDLIPVSLKVLHDAAIADETSGPIICNEAIPDTCPAEG